VVPVSLISAISKSLTRIAFAQHVLYNKLITYLAVDISNRLYDIIHPSQLPTPKRKVPETAMASIHRYIGINCPPI
jgi:hypothetical protein